VLETSLSNSIVSVGGDVPHKYEKQLQKLEADVRQHIRVEQQLKLHIESI